MTTVKDEAGNEVLFATEELEALRAHMEAAKTDPDYKVVYHSGAPLYRGACDAIAEGLSEELAEPFDGNDALAAMETDTIVTERPEPEPPMAASLIAEPQPSAKELLTQEVIADLDMVTVAAKEWSLPEVTKALDIEDVSEPETDDELRNRLAQDPLVIHLREYVAKLADEDEGPTLQEALDEVGFAPVPGVRLVLDEGAAIIEDVGDLLNASEPIATSAPTTPRKKLMLLDDEELF
jgi:hypothetical protein